MRGFFALLMLSNLLYFGWAFYFDDRPDGDKLSLDMPGERLIMLSELAPNERPPLRKGQLERVISSPPLDDPEKVQSISALGDTRCLMVRSIQDKAEVDKLISQLRESGALQIETGEDAGVRTNYWVMLPAFRSRDEANLVANRLSGQQLRDFFVIRSGEHENAISLGVFSSEDRAQRRQAQISALKLNGIKPEIEMIQLPVRSHWVGFRVGTGGNRLSAEVLQAFGEVRESDCP